MVLRGGGLERGNGRQECIRAERCAGVRVAAPPTQVGVYNGAPALSVYLPAAPRWDVPEPPIGRLTCAEYIFASARAKYATDAVDVTPRQYAARTRDTFYLCLAHAL
uniref:Uncharacterized protein n=1 Tax=Schizaphis graminum TaxID=13262 RepID=A0A2S2NJR1_SCHGA